MVNGFLSQGADRGGAVGTGLEAVTDERAVELMIQVPARKEGRRGVSRQGVEFPVA